MGDEAVQPHSVTLSPVNWEWLGRQAAVQRRSRSQVIDGLISDHRRASFTARDVSEPSRPMQEQFATSERPVDIPEPKRLERKVVEPRWKS